MKTLALFHFRKPYNCAQAVYKSMEKHHAISHETMEKLSDMGGGCAEGGTCGALYAALQIIDDPAGQTEIKEYFEAHGGSTLCRKLRRGKKMFCRDCVATAAEWAEKFITTQKEACHA